MLKASRKEAPAPKPAPATERPVSYWRMATSGFFHSQRFSVSVTKRLSQHPVESQFLWVPELLDANCHALVSGFGLGPIGAKEPVPPRQIEPEVAVRLLPHDKSGTGLTGLLTPAMLSRCLPAF